MEEAVEATEEAEEAGGETEETEEVVEEAEVPAEEAEEVEEEEAILEAEEERAVEKEEKKEIEEEIVEENFYTIQLRMAWVSPRKKRAPRAMRLVKSFVRRHMKLRTEAEEGEEAERLVISNEVNEKIWGRGIEKPPRRIRVRAVKDREGIVTLYLAEGD